MDKFIVSDGEGKFVAAFANERPAVLFLNYIMVPFFRGEYTLASPDGQEIDWDLFPCDKSIR